MSKNTCLRLFVAFTADDDVFASYGSAEGVLVESLIVDCHTSQLWSTMRAIPQ